LIINKILSGDPTRGNMAIDTIMDLKEGQFAKVNYKFEFLILIKILI